MVVVPVVVLVVVVAGGVVVVVAVAVVVGRGRDDTSIPETCLAAQAETNNFDSRLPFKIGEDYALKSWRFCVLQAVYGLFGFRVLSSKKQCCIVWSQLLHGLSQLKQSGQSNPTLKPSDPERPNPVP